jgi:hypothetical protein
MTVFFFIYLAAFILAVVAAAGKAPVWVSVVLVTIGLMIQTFPK